MTEQCGRGGKTTGTLNYDRASSDLRGKNTTSHCMSHPNNSGFCKKTSSIVNHVGIILHFSEGRDNRDVFSSWFGPQSEVTIIMEDFFSSVFKNKKYAFYTLCSILQNVTVNSFLRNRLQFIFCKTSVRIGRYLFFKY